MNSCGDEQRVDAKVGRALQVRAHRIPDRQHPPPIVAAAARALGQRQRLLVDRSIGFAGIEHLAAGGGVAVRDRAGAVDQPVAAFDHHVGIGADHQQRARAHARDQLVVIGGRLDRVVVEARAHHIVGLLERRDTGVEPFEHRQVAHRTDMEDLLARSRGDDGPRDIA